MVTAECKGTARAGRARLHGDTRQGQMCAWACVRYLNSGWMNFLRHCWVNSPWLNIISRMDVVTSGFACSAPILSWFENSSSAAVSARTAPGLSQSVGSTSLLSSYSGVGAWEGPNGTNVALSPDSAGATGKEKPSSCWGCSWGTFPGATGGHRWGGPAGEQADTGKQLPREPRGSATFKAQTTHKLLVIFQFLSQSNSLPVSQSELALSICNKKSPH